MASRGQHKGVKQAHAAWHDSEEVGLCCLWQADKGRWQDGTPEIICTAIARFAMMTGQAGASTMGAWGEGQGVALGQNLAGLHSLQGFPCGR